MKWRWFLGLLIVVGGIGLGWWSSFGRGQAQPAAVYLNVPTPAEVAALQTFTPSPSASATLPATFTPIPTITNTPPPNTTATPTPSKTPTPTLTLPPPTPTLPFLPAITATLSVSNTIIAGFTPVPTLETPNGTTNILLLGNDNDPATGQVGGRTDTIIIVSINTEQETASMLSIPRDLFVSVPGWIPNRINTVLARGDSSGYTGGGVQLLKDTILYNLGISIDYYARVDFKSFQQIVDAIGGVSVAVSCELTDWRLKSPDLDILVEDNWEIFTLAPGIYQMDGDMALWYARSRRTTSDFDRGRRQQQILRAMLNKGVDLNLITQAPALWDTYSQNVETDLSLAKMLQLATIASAVRENGIQHIYLTQGELTAWTTPETGAQVQLLNYEIARPTLSRLYEVPTINRSNRTPITVEIINGTGNPDMAKLAAENLAWYGFVPVFGEDTADNPATALTYYGTNFKGSYNWLISWLFNKGRSQIVLDAETSYPYNYRAVIGPDYSPCRNPLYAPAPTDGD